jgi:hypothetical protein
MDPHFLHLGTSWRWVVSFTPLPLYPRERAPRYPFYRRLGGLQSRSGRYGEVKIFYPTGTRTPAPPSRPARSQSLYRLSYPGSQRSNVECKKEKKRKWKYPRLETRHLFPNFSYLGGTNNPINCDRWIHCIERCQFLGNGLLKRLRDVQLERSVAEQPSIHTFLRGRTDVHCQSTDRYTFVPAAMTESFAWQQGK